MIQTERLTEKDYDEALYVLNNSFVRNGVPEDFEKSLPIMWTREHQYMERHFGIREEGKLVAILGVYPLEVSIAGHTLLFATMGNIGTLPEARGKGYMKRLLEEGLRELDRLKIDVARLSGKRSRYNRFLFERSASQYIFQLTSRNAQEFPPDQAYTFRPIAADDKEAVAFARACQQRAAIHALRPTHTDFYMSMRAWAHQPYLALDASGEPAGYMCLSENGQEIPELGVREGIEAYNMLTAFLLSRSAEAFSVIMQPIDTFMTRKMIRHCESWVAEPPSMFKVIHWDRLINALMALRCQTACLPGSAVIGIEGYGSLELTAANGAGSARRTNAPADLTLSPLQATQCLLGPFGMDVAADASWPAVLSSWLPLPMSWNGQDRV